MITSGLDVGKAVFGAVQGGCGFSPPQVLGEENSQKVTHMGVAFEVDKSP